MIRNKNIQWSNFGKEAHLVNSNNHGVHHFIFKRLQYNCPVFDFKFYRTSAGAVLNHSLSSSFVTEDSDNIAMTSGAVTLDLGQKGLLQ